jgi:hypothetical protein
LYFEAGLQPVSNRVVYIPTREKINRYRFQFPGISNEKAITYLLDKKVRIEWLCDKLMKCAGLFGSIAYIAIDTLNTNGESNEVLPDSSKTDYLNWLEKCRISKDVAILLTLSGKQKETDFLFEIKFELSNFLDTEVPLIPIVETRLLTYHEPNVTVPVVEKMSDLISILSLKKDIST